MHVICVVYLYISKWIPWSQMLSVVYSRLFNLQNKYVDAPHRYNQNHHLLFIAWYLFTVALSGMYSLFSFIWIGNLSSSKICYRTNSDILYDLPFSTMEVKSYQWYENLYASVNWISTGSGKGLAPNRRQAITWTNVHLLSIEPLGTSFSEIRIKIQNFSLKKMHLKMPSAKWQPFCPGRDELKPEGCAYMFVTISFFTLHDTVLFIVYSLYIDFSHYSDAIMNEMASEIAGISNVHSTVCLGADQRKHQSSASLAIVREFTKGQ